MGAVVNEGAADMSCDFGRRMLAKFGWEEGKGLGKREDGMKSHIVAKQRAELLGLGATTAAASVAWAPPADLPGPPPKSLKQKKPKKGKKGMGDDDTTVNMFGVKPVGSGIIPGLDDSAIFAMCGGARLGRRSHPGLQVGKEKRVMDADAEFMAKYANKSAAAPVAAAPVAAAAPAPAAAAPSLSASDAEAKAEKARKKEKKRQKRLSAGDGGEEKASKKQKAERKEKKEKRAAAGEKKAKKDKSGKGGDAASPRRSPRVAAVKDKAEAVSQLAI